MTIVPADDLPDSPAPQAAASPAGGLVPADDLPGSDIPTMTVTASQPPSPTPKADAPPMTEAQRLGTGVMDPLVGIGQIGGHAVGALPAPVGNTMERANDYLADLTGSPKSPRGLFTGEGADAAVKRREASIPPEPGGGHDWSRLAGNIVSPANMIAPGAGLVSKAAPAIGRIGSGIIQGATVGAMQPATGSNFGVEKGLQAGLGAVVGGGASAVQEAIIPWLTGLHGEAGIQDKAVQTVLKRIQTDQKGGGASFQDMLDLANATPDKPLVLADVVDANAKGLLGKIARTPGQAKQEIAKFVKDRDLDTGTRVVGDVNDVFGSNPTLFADQALAKARSQAAKPLFDKAREGGSIAPLETQFRNAFNDASKIEKEAHQAVSDAQSKVTQAAARQNQAGNNVYGNAGANQDMRAAQADLVKATQNLQRAGDSKQQILDRLHQSQDDIANNAPGAVWSPRLQEFLDHPDVQQGIKRGWKIERNDALAEGRPIVDKEYAIVGHDDAGDPIVGKVPTMKLLMVAKEGIDAMLEGDSMRTQFGELNKMGVSLDKVRKEFISELDRLNPDYKPARDSWAGHTDSRIALKDGQKVFSTEPEKIKYQFENEFTDSEKEFYRLGAANVMRKMVRQTGEAGDETRRLIGSEQSRLQLRAMFPSDQEFEHFFASLNAENLMFNTWAKTYGGSNSADKLAEDLRPEMNAASHAVRAGAAAHSGWWPGFISHGMQAVGRILPNTNPAALSAQGRLYRTPVPEAVQILQGATARAPQSRVAPYVIPGLVESTSPDMNSQ